MSSDAYITGVCLGQQKQHIKNIRPIEVLILNLNGAYISVQSVRGTVSHRAAAKRGRRGNTGRRLGSTQPATAVQRNWACRTRTAHGLCVSYLSSTWYISRLCAHEILLIGENTYNILPVRADKTRPLLLKIAKLCYPFPPGEKIRGVPTHSREHGSRPES